MLSSSGPSLAEVGYLTSQQLETWTRSIAQKKQTLEDDINDYIRRKQDELHNYEREVPVSYPAADRLIGLTGLASRAVSLNGKRARQP